MTTYTNDPIRVKITLDDIWRLTHKPGIDSTFYPSEQKNEYYCKFVTNSINPHSPQQECYREDLEREISKLKVIQDHIREFSPYRHFNNDTKKTRTIETILDENIFAKDNRYDVLIDKFNKTVHLLPNGKRFITVEDA